MTEIGRDWPVALPRLPRCLFGALSAPQRIMDRAGQALESGAGPRPLIGRGLAFAERHGQGVSWPGLAVMLFSYISANHQTGR